MKILKLLNRKSFTIILLSLFSFGVCAEDQPVDIWSIEKEKNDEKLLTNEIIINENPENKTQNEFNIYNIQSQKEDDSIKLEETSNTNEIKILPIKSNKFVIFIYYVNHHRMVDY